MICSLFSRALLRSLMSVGKVISAGVQVASIINWPLFEGDCLVLSAFWSLLGDWPPLGGSWFSRIFFAMALLTSLSTSGGKRLRKWTNMEASKGSSVIKALRPQKYWRYGFSMICSTQALSLAFSSSLMMSAARAILTESAGCPMPLLEKFFLYRSSNSSHGMSAAIFTHLLSRESSPWKGKAKSGSSSCFRLCLYMIYCREVQGFGMTNEIYCALSTLILMHFNHKFKHIIIVQQPLIT